MDFKVQNLESDKEEKVSFIIWGSLSKPTLMSVHRIVYNTVNPQ